MIAYIRRTAIELGFGVNIGRSDNGSDRRKAFVILGCERSGKYQAPLRKLKKDETGTRRCECPFKIGGYMLVSKKWRFTVCCGIHNHEMCSKLQGHPSVCRLKVEGKTCIADMTLNLVQPKNTLATLKRKEPENVANIKQVYNIRYQMNKAIRGDRSEMQQLLKVLEDNDYVSRYRYRDDGITVRDIFWTHPDSIKLFNTFSTVLILDSTYKTNKYRLPLFEMVGVTSTDKTYVVGFAFLECEKEDNFTWALEMCRSLLKKHVQMPKAIVTDHDNALMNAVAKVFPSSNALLCRFHITKNVRSRVKTTVGVKQVESEDGKVVKSGVIVEKIMDAWTHILNSSTTELYADSVIKFRKVCERYPALLKYVESTILDQVKEKTVCAWTDNVRHLENTTTNRVESAHATLKNWLGNSSGDLCRDWDSVHLMIKNQHNEIQATFVRSIMVLEHRFKGNFLYSQLIGNMSRARLGYIFHEANRAETVGANSAKCGCTIMKTYGLPCACAIAKKLKLGEPIQIDEVCPHWMRLSFDDDGCKEGDKPDISILAELEAIQNIFSKAVEIQIEFRI